MATLAHPSSRVDAARAGTATSTAAARENTSRVQPSWQRRRRPQGDTVPGHCDGDGRPHRDRGVDVGEVQIQCRVLPAAQRVGDVHRPSLGLRGRSTVLLTRKVTACEQGGPPTTSDSIATVGPPFVMIDHATCWQLQLLYLNTKLQTLTRSTVITW
jgi:hypothetical protein